MNGRNSARRTLRGPSDALGRSLRSRRPDTITSPVAVSQSVCFSQSTHSLETM